MQWNVVWITGASSGIGHALAVRLARAGAKVAASARNGEALAELAAAEPNIRAYPLDVTDGAATKLTVERIGAELGAIDLAVLNAGVWKPMGISRFTAEVAAQSMAVNHGGICNGLAALMPDMIQRGRGQIALVSSVAGYCGLPKSAAYGPSKAAVINLAEALYPELREKGVMLSLVNPGFVDTPMTESNKFPMPYLMNVDDAVSHIVRGLTARKFEIAFPWQMVTLLKLAKRAPYPLYFWIARTFLAPASKRGDDAGKRSSA